MVPEEYKKRMSIRNRNGNLCTRIKRLRRIFFVSTVAADKNSISIRNRNSSPCTVTNYWEEFLSVRSSAIENFLFVVGGKVFQGGECFSYM